MLKWMLDGLKDYHREGFRVIPESCLAFKNSIVAEKDVVMEFLNSCVQQGEAKEYVKVCDLYHTYGEQNRDMQQNRKTKKTMKDFEKALKRCLGVHRFKDKHQQMIAGKNHTMGKVFMGFKTIV